MGGAEPPSRGLSSAEVPRLCAVRMVYDGPARPAGKVAVGQVISSRALGGRLPQDKLDRIERAGQAFLDEARHVLAEHGGGGATRLSLSGTLMLVSRAPRGATNAQNVENGARPHWISIIGQGREGSLHQLLLDAAETVADPQQRAAEPPPSAPEDGPDLMELLNVDVVCANCRATLGEEWSEECASCLAKWCGACGVAVRRIGQCTCCFEYDRLRPRVPPPAGPLADYYAGGSGSGGGGRRSTESEESTYSDTESEEDLYPRHGEAGGRVCGAKRRRGAKAWRRSSRRVMKHGDNIGVWPRRYICCGTHQPYETLEPPTCRRRTWVGTLDKALEHAQQKHGLKDLRWKKTDTHWMCLTDACAVASGARHLGYAAPTSAFAVPITPAPDGTPARSTEWETRAFEHMRMAHGVKHLHTRQEAMPTDGPHRSHHRHHHHHHYRFRRDRAKRVRRADPLCCPPGPWAGGNHGPPPSLYGYAYGGAAPGQRPGYHPPAYAPLPLPLPAIEPVQGPAPEPAPVVKPEAVEDALPSLDAIGFAGAPFEL